MRLLAILAVLIALASALLLERERAGLTVTHLTVADAPVTLWRPEGTEPLPLVVVAHGFAGSRQMMRAFAVTLARSGLAVAAIDLPGHGRHPRPMTGDVTRLDGATAMLTREVVAVTQALQERAGTGETLALLGHSMATDIVIRAAETLDPEAIVAVSMYSEAVTPEAPARLLILSGAREERLRAVALEALRMVDAEAQEGETAEAPGVLRRAAAAPVVGHVGVLYAPPALAEARDWILPALDAPRSGQPPWTGLWLGTLLLAIVAMARPLSAAVAPTQAAAPGPSWRLTARASLLPLVPAVGAAALTPALGLPMAFAPIAAFLGVWGVVQGAVLWRARMRLPAPRLLAGIVLAAWSLLFALALDRYGAAFLPAGPRLPLALLLLIPALVFAYADALLTQGAGWAMRLVARAAPLAGLLAAMLLDPPLGVAFTVLPVMVLFWLVFGTGARWMAARSGAGSTAPILGITLAWAIAASTPLIAG